LFSFVQFQVKPINFDGMSKGSAVILDFCILQGSVATQLRRGERKQCNSYIDRISLRICSEIMLKIGLHLLKL